MPLKLRSLLPDPAWVGGLIEGLKCPAIDRPA